MSALTSNGEDQPASFNHFIGADQQRLRDRQAERLGGTVLMTSSNLTGTYRSSVDDRPITAGMLWVLPSELSIG